MPFRNVLRRMGGKNSSLGQMGDTGMERNSIQRCSLGSSRNWRTWRSPSRKEVHVQIPTSKTTAQPAHLRMPCRNVQRRAQSEQLFRISRSNASTHSQTRLQRDSNHGDSRTRLLRQLWIPRDEFLCPKQSLWNS